MTVNEIERWDYNDREVLYNDSPDLAESGWKSVDSVFLFLTISNLIEDRNTLRELLQEAHDEALRPEHDWNLEFAREVNRALDRG